MLLDAAVAPESCSAARAIGYRQALAQLHTWRDNPDTITADSVVCPVNLDLVNSHLYTYMQPAIHTTGSSTPAIVSQGGCLNPAPAIW